MTSESILENFYPEEFNPFMLVLSSESILEYFCQEGFAHQSLKIFQLLKILIKTIQLTLRHFYQKLIARKKSKNKNKKIKMSSKRLLDNS